MDLLLFRLSLKAKELIDLFEERTPDGSTLSREAWIRQFFSIQRPFSHWNSDFLFIPEPRLSSPAGYLFGWIGREKILRERTPPNQGFEPTEHGSWQASFIAIDPTHHDDGQKAALESNSNVGDAAAVMKSLAKAMNRQEQPPFEAAVYPITETGSFWAFAQEHDNRIKRITFDIAVPNMFDGADDFQEENRAIRDRLNGARVRTSIESDTVLNHGDSKLSEIIDYTEEGGGKLLATAEDGETYSSDRFAKSVTVEVEHHSKGLDEFLRQISTFLDRIF